MQLLPFLIAAGATQTECYRACKISRTVMGRMANDGAWPQDPTAPGRVADFLAAKGLAAEQVAQVREFKVPMKVKGPGVQQHTGASPEATLDEQQEETMLLRCEPVRPETRQHFGLARSPFHDDIRTRADVFATPATRYARAALYDCAVNHGFVALVAESGAGKSTLVEELEQRILDDQRPVVIIRPSVLSMDGSNPSGKSTMKSGQIAEAIIRTLAPGDTPKSSPEARDRQLKDVLIASHSAGYSHLLLIEEAHNLPTATLNNLKCYTELKQGLSRLLGVALIGQTELLKKLSDKKADVRQIVQRCEIIELRPLDNDLEAYIGHKFERVGAKASDVLEDGVYDAMRARLVRVPRGGTEREALSVCHPLVVNNLVARAMNAAASAGFARVTADVISGV